MYSEWDNTRWHSHIRKSHCLENLCPKMYLWMVRVLDSGILKNLND